MQTLGNKYTNPRKVNYHERTAMNESHIPFTYERNDIPPH